MAVVTMKQLLEAGVHFGHQTRRWNPKMKRFIFGERGGIYIIDLQQTLTRIESSYSFVRDLVADGGTVLFIGTKKQAQDPIQSYAEKVGMPYINQRWLGGMLTNFETIGKRVAKMQEYRRMRASGEFDVMPKKEALLLSRELEKLERNLGGIAQMDRLPDAVFILDTKKEHIGVTEANKLGIPIIAVVDTNCDPDIIQYVIPGNDDAIRSGSLMCRVIADAVEEGRFIASRRGNGNGAAAAAPVALRGRGGAGRRLAGRGPSPGAPRPAGARRPPRLGPGSGHPAAPGPPRDRGARRRGSGRRGPPPRRPPPRPAVPRPLPPRPPPPSPRLPPRPTTPDPPEPQHRRSKSTPCRSPPRTYRPFARPPAPG